MGADGRRPVVGPKPIETPRGAPVPPQAAGDERDRRGGFVLLAVLGVAALLSAVVLALSFVARTSVDTAVIATEELQADALVTAGVELAGFQLFGQAARPSALSGQRIRLDDGTLTLFAASEAAKVDLNGASLDLLAGLYRQSRLTALTPEVFAARVVDWRDDDDTPTRGGGAEAAEYASEGLDHAPTDRPFRTVAELRFVLGVGPADVAILSPLLTVNNPKGKIDANAAPVMILDAVPGMTPATRDRILAMRAEGPIDLTRTATQEALSDALSYLETDPVSPTRVRIEARPSSGRFQRTVELVMIPSAVENKLYQVTAWQER